MKKVILATLICGAAMSSSVFAADAGKGKVTFTGSIITAPCSIAPGDESQEVPLGQISNVTLENGGMSSAQPFNIRLEGCNLNATYTEKDAQGNDIEKTYNNTVNVSFYGTEWNDTGLISITGTGAGAGVKLMNDSGDTIKINSSTTQNFVTGNNTLSFQAGLQGVKGTAVTPGVFTAATNFVLTYN
ncbi:MULTISPECIES: fimbrial protein [Providencia]|uniref:Fimbrial protein n=1 Tax=Providencia rettgeri TaxID=587 RepID=A0A219X553_PRORE|nr:MULTISPECIES: fimbrial protein [Providencia]APC14108.1 Fimbria A protein precursor,fimbrial protein StdA,P pilus assembly protein, pilin FimA,Fimbrial protein [Providencia rettgeri]MBG5929713.1 fimbrial protein [Providencia rettgeri]MBN6367786.1 fimbrial protein [Providencia rettgeri]OZS73030.1 fimbrial protein [Providencia rettgeri]HEC8326454.1 fimbrial protein [Providencia rettgeri]